eukprot:TRINITY_DN122178_c0_g1_i1.p1 TRINITY_DN122178_c0_g1~~TRINITY_DN122178_c0_g1_i1.p1  ORF type:complete len:584 (+),score=91.90 TRINITY_DN122178_c0_g1_i1:130-1881(+)
MLPRMQLAALGSNAWLPSATCCCCIPAAWGGILICLYLLFRGMEMVREGRAGETDAFLGAPWQHEPFLVTYARGTLLVMSFIDVVVAVVGTLGIALRRAGLVAVLSLWMLLRLVPEVFVILAAFTYNVSPYSTGQLFCLAVLWMGFDIYLALAGLEVLLVVTLRGTVAPHFLLLLRKAQRLTLEDSYPACSREHLLAVLLEDPTCHAMLVSGKVDLAKLARLLPRAVEHRYVLPPPGDLAFAPDAEADLYNACVLQSDEGDQILTADHLLLAMCSTGILKVRGEEFRVDTHSILAHLRAAKGAERCVDDHNVPLGTSLLGCLPLEETVLTWTIVRVIAAVIWFVYWIMGLLNPVDVKDVYEYSALGRNHTWQTRLVELVLTFVGGLFSAYAMAGILYHREARWLVLERARDLGLPAAGLGAAFQAVWDSGEPEIKDWLELLKFGSTTTRRFFFFSVFEATCDVPIFGMLLTLGNVCGSYIHGAMNIARIGLFFSSPTPMHCEYSDWALMFFIALWVSFKVGACWATFLLWHLYQHGWVTNEDKGMGYLKSCSILPDAVTRSLAGLPRYMPRKEYDPEAKPILL